MTQFEMGKTYFVRKENFYYLEFKCTRCFMNEACFMLTKIDANATLDKCPVLFSILKDFYTNFYGKMMPIYTTSEIEDGDIRQVVFSDYENYLWIDSQNEV